MPFLRKQVGYSFRDFTRTVLVWYTGTVSTYGVAIILRTWNFELLN